MPIPEQVKILLVDHLEPKTDAEYVGRTVKIARGYDGAGMDKFQADFVIWGPIGIGGINGLNLLLKRGGSLDTQVDASRVAPMSSAAAGRCDVRLGSQQFT